jgi:hypothetical protein
VPAYAVAAVMQHVHGAPHATATQLSPPLQDASVPMHLTVNAGVPALMAAVVGRQSLSRTRPGSRLHAVTGGIGTPRRRQARRRPQGAAAAAADEAVAMVAQMQSHLAALPGLPCGGGGSPSLQRAPRPTPTFLASPQ